MALPSLFGFELGLALFALAAGLGIPLTVLVGRNYSFGDSRREGGYTLFYLAINLASGRLRRKFFLLSARTLWADLLAALKGRLAHADPQHYNMVQRLAYLFVMLDSVLLVVSGLVLWKSVQFPLLREFLWGYEGARRVHFFAMAALAAFVAIHLVMVALVPRTLIYMVRGR